MEGLPCLHLDQFFLNLPVSLSAITQRAIVDFPATAVSNYLEFVRDLQKCDTCSSYGSAMQQTKRLCSSNIFIDSENEAKNGSDGRRRKCSVSTIFNFPIALYLNHGIAVSESRMHYWGTAH